MNSGGGNTVIGESLHSDTGVAIGFSRLLALMRPIAELSPATETCAALPKA